jgi:murein DD-endopeptidase MepM/ murein hydrolase activator NlpD
VDGLPDLPPPERDRENPAGNHVVISCMNVELLMAHMENGSVAVEAGERVETGQLVGRVGNSGNTTEPHLHIHAVEGGGPGVFQDDAVPILFRRRLPTRNTLFVVE